MYVCVVDDLKALIVTCGGSVVTQAEQFEQGFQRFIITCVDFEDSEETVPNEDILKFNSKYLRRALYLDILMSIEMNDVR